jgi:hypothetical protein
MIDHQVRAEDHHTRRPPRTAAVAPWAWLLGRCHCQRRFAHVARSRRAAWFAARSILTAAIDRNIANAAAAVGALLQQTETATAQPKSRPLRVRVVAATVRNAC